MQSTSFSKIIAGTMLWGVWGKKCSTPQYLELIESCLENGITTFDHADIYGGYTTEAEFGAAFRLGGIDRTKIQLITKCGIQMESEQRGNRVKHYQYDREYIISTVEQSLRNLQTEYLDVLLLHRPSPLMQAEEIAEAVHVLKQSGKILDFGVSNFTNSQTELLRSLVSVSYNQIQFSLTHCEAMTDGSLDYMQTHGIKPMAWSPLGSVFKSEDEQAQRVGDLARSLAQKYGVPVSTVLLAWILRHPAGIIPVCGTGDPKRIPEMMQSTSLTLELQDWFALWSASMGRRVA